MKTLRCSVDRIEDELAVLVSDDNRTLHLKAKDYSLSVNDVVDITLEGDKITTVKKQPEEAHSRYEKNEGRLKALFAKNKK